MVSSTAPRFGPRCPPVRETAATRKSRISAANCGNTPAGRRRTSSGARTVSSRVTARLLRGRGVVAATCAFVVVATVRILGGGQAPGEEHREHAGGRRVAPVRGSPPRPRPPGRPRGSPGDEPAAGDQQSASARLHVGPLAGAAAGTRPEEDPHLGRGGD